MDSDSRRRKRVSVAKAACDRDRTTRRAITKRSTSWRQTPEKRMFAKNWRRLTLSLEWNSVDEDVFDFGLVG